MRVSCHFEILPELISLKHSSSLSWNLVLWANKSYHPIFVSISEYCWSTYIHRPLILSFFAGLHTDRLQQGGAPAASGLRLGGRDGMGHIGLVPLLVVEAVGLPGLLCGPPLLCCWGPQGPQDLGR